MYNDRVSYVSDGQVLIMKVICVRNREIQGFIVGKWYDSKDSLYQQRASPGYIFVKGDEGLWSYLDRKYFRTVEELREDKLKEIGI